MRLLFVLALFALVNLKLMAQDLPTNVLFEYTKILSFTRTEYRGIYRFQLLTNGILQKVNNQSDTVVVAQLSRFEVKKIEKAINNIRSLELGTPRGRLCSDSPIETIIVRQINGTNIVISRRAACKIAINSDPKAKNVLNIVNNLKDIFYDKRVP